MPARRPPSLAFSTFVLVLAADVLLWGHVPGWSLAPLALLTAALLVARRPELRQSPSAHVALALLVVLCGALVLDAGTVATGLTLAILFVLALAGRHGWVRGVGEWTGLVLGLVLSLVWRFLADSWRLRVAALRRPSLRLRIAGLAPALAATLLPLGFLLLFGIANPILGSWILNLTQSMEPLLDPLRWFWWCALVLTAWAVLRARSVPLPKGMPRASGNDLSALLDRNEVLVRTLAGCNAVFLLQTVLDARYLWFGRALPQEFTYAQYAQRGAYPLLLAALLAGLFVLWAWRDGARERPRLARILVLPWLAQTLLLTVAAAWRLGLYVEAYGLTRLRLAAALWMLLVSFGLLAIAWRLLTRATSHRLVQVNLAAAVGLLVACSYANLDGAIATFNVAHCRELGGRGTQVDIAYLESLGEEAIPALRRLERDTEAILVEASVSGSAHLQMGTAMTRGKARQARGRLERELKLRLAEPLAWTWRRAALGEGSAWPQRALASSLSGSSTP